MKTQQNCRHPRGFTLVGLLVVISMIIVLAAMSFGAISIATRKKNAVTTLASVSAHSRALDANYSEYQKLPTVGAGDEIQMDGQSGAELLTNLLGKERAGTTMQNPRQLTLLNAQFTKNKNKGSLIFINGDQPDGLYDAWGRPLRVKFDDDYDDDYDNEIRNPFYQGDIVRQKRAVVWSFDPDGKFGDNDEGKSW